MKNEKTTKITLFNDFHNTEVNVCVRFNSSIATLTPSQTSRVRRELCGNSDCLCGTLRGSQGDYDVEEVMAAPRKGVTTVYRIEEMENEYDERNRRVEAMGD